MGQRYNDLVEQARLARESIEGPTTEQEPPGIGLPALGDMRMKDLKRQAH